MWTIADVILTCERLPFADNSFDFVTYTDIIEHHAFSPKRVLAEFIVYLFPVPGDTRYAQSRYDRV
ncbi:MAG: methyltransferase domain-containing protein [Candidatus Acidiferrales bacterium]